VPPRQQPRKPRQEHRDAAGRGPRPVQPAEQPERAAAHVGPEEAPGRRPVPARQAGNDPLEPPGPAAPGAAPTVRVRGSGRERWQAAHAQRLLQSPRRPRLRPRTRYARPTPPNLYPTLPRPVAPPAHTLDNCRKAETSPCNLRASSSCRRYALLLGDPQVVLATSLLPGGAGREGPYKPHDPPQGLLRRGDEAHQRDGDGRGHERAGPREPRDIQAGVRRAAAPVAQPEARGLDAFVGWLGRYLRLGPQPSGPAGRPRGRQGQAAPALREPLRPEARAARRG
jgi:hypothetical protein